MMAARVLLAALYAGRLVAQEPVPVGEEPMHRVVFANERVRVIDAVLPPGRTSLYHAHDRDNVPIVVGAGRVTVQPLGGASTEADASLGTVTFAAGGYAHRVGNAGAAEVRYIDVELQGTPSRRAATSEFVPPGHQLVLQNDRVRAWRVVLAPGARLPAHAHSAAAVHVTIRGGTPGSVRWLPAGESTAVANDGTGPYELVEVELLD